MKTKFKIVGLALVLCTVMWAYKEYHRIPGVQRNIKMLPSELLFLSLLLYASNTGNLFSFELSGIGVLY